MVDVMQDGTLVEMKMEDYEKMTENSREMETSVPKKASSISKGTIINVGNTTITKRNVTGKTMPAILRQTSKTPQVIKMVIKKNSKIFFFEINFEKIIII